jgi:hypothetical protein
VVAPRDAHEWVSFEDVDEDRTWRFDVTFLTSPWTCIFGAGCEGVLTGPARELEQGCCSYGAHFSDAADVARIEAAAATLGEADWQFLEIGRRDGITRREDDDQATALVDDACIFLNRPGFAGGPGCALHRAALARGVEPLEMKPDVCWQLPLRREDTTDDRGHVTTTVTEWARHNWGDAGAEFHWWCTEERSAFVGAVPVYKSLRPELCALVGEGVYARLTGYLTERGRAATFLAHPVLRVRGPRRAGSRPS